MLTCDEFCCQVMTVIARHHLRRALRVAFLPKLFQQAPSLRDVHFCSHDILLLLGLKRLHFESFCPKTLQQEIYGLYVASIKLFFKPRSCSNYSIFLLKLHKVQVMCVHAAFLPTFSPLVLFYLSLTF